MRLLTLLSLTIFAIILKAQNVGVGTTMPASTLEVNGSVANKVTTITGNTTIDASHAVVICNSASNFTVTLPTAVGITGRTYTIKNVNTGIITITPAGGQTIDGSSNKLLSAPNNAIQLISDGGNWQIINDVNPKPAVLLFATDFSVGNNDYVGLGTSGASFVRYCIVVPFDCELNSITFSIRANILNLNITSEVWVNGLLTSLSATIANGLSNIWATGIGSVPVLQGDLISVKIHWTSGGALASGIAASVTYK